MPEKTRNAIANLSHTHEALLNWLVVNPDKTLRQCADHFGYTPQWLSAILHSDLFQAALKEKQIAITSKIAMGLTEQLKNLAHVAVDKLGQAIEKSEDGEFLLDATDKILHRLGYAPASARNPLGNVATQQVQQNFYITAGDLQEARALMQEVSRPSLPAPLEGEVLRED